MNKTKTVTESNEVTLPSGLFICGAEVFKQLNGTSVYVVFSGTEEKIVDAYNTLYNANAFSGELEFLTSALAFTTSTPQAFKQGLFNRQEMRLVMDTPSPLCNCESWINKTAKANAEHDFQNVRDIRAVMPVEALIPERYELRDIALHTSSDALVYGKQTTEGAEWQNEPTDHNAE